MRTFSTPAFFSRDAGDKSLHRTVRPQADEVVRHCFCKTHASASRQRVVLRHCKQKLVFKKRQRLQAGRAHVAGHDADVGAPINDCLDDVGAAQLAQIDVHRRMFG